jgi:hypothetical protein
MWLKVPTDLICVKIAYWQLLDCYLTPTPQYKSNHFQKEILNEKL